MQRINGHSPLKRESRPAFVAQRLPVDCQLGGDNTDNNTETLQLQRVISVCGVSPRFATVIAPLVFGGAA